MGNPAIAALGLSEEISPCTIAVGVRGGAREVRGSVTHNVSSLRISMDIRGMVDQRDEISVWVNEMPWRRALWLENAGEAVVHSSPLLIDCFLENLTKIQLSVAQFQLSAI